MAAVVCNDNISLLTSLHPIFKLKSKDCIQRCSPLIDLWNERVIIGVRSFLEGCSNMNFNELAKARLSCRKYSDKAVEHEKLVEIVKAGTLSPSACNSQPWHYVVVSEEEVVAKMPQALQVGGINKFTDQVPAYIVVCETKAQLIAGVTCDRQYYAQMDIGLTVAHLVLSAKSQGLDTCIMGAFQEEPIKALLSIPAEANIRLVIAVGYAFEERTREKPRKDFDSVCSFNQW